MPKTDDVLAAAQRVFLRFGFRRSTMGDIAEEAGISRPALYPLFASKEAIFIAGLTRVFADELDEIRALVADAHKPADKLTAALEVWCVRNYELTTGSPGAKDLYESCYAVAPALTNKVDADFEKIVTTILGGKKDLARLITGSMVGLKLQAKNAKELRRSLQTLVTVVTR
jgi:AcrR family transcriptional regulator